MIRSDTREQYTITVGIECHVQLKTATKLFAAVGNDARQAPPNTLVSHICFGMPGALPVLNREAVRLAARAAFALGTRPAHFSKFDRKHYFYPDLPKGYQISQYDEPIIGPGAIDVPMPGDDSDGPRMLRVGITRAHLEEDAGKSTHPAGAAYSLVDLNRAGTPLLEIVSEPDIHSAAEARAYAHELYLRMKYAGVSDCDLYLGHMRFDVNVSVSKDPARRGTRTESKNLNSFRSVEKAVQYEADRQIELLEKGEAIAQETRGWDEAKQRTVSQRTKEEAHDYRYMPDPDIPPIELDDAYIDAVAQELPPAPAAIRTSLRSSGLKPAEIEVLLEANVTGTTDGYYIPLLQSFDDAKLQRYAANWLLNRHMAEAQKRLQETGTRLLPTRDNLPTAAQLADVYRLHVQDKQLNSNNADALLFDLSIGGSMLLKTYDPQAVLPKRADRAASRASDVAKAKGYLQISDESAIAVIVSEVLASNAAAAADVRRGEDKAIGFLVGQVMKASRGAANPSLAAQLIRKQLEA